MHKIAVFDQSGASKDKKKASDWLEAAALCNSTYASMNAARGAQVDIRVELKTRVRVQTRVRVRTAPERPSPRVRARNCHLSQISDKGHTTRRKWVRVRQGDAKSIFERGRKLFFTDPEGERSELDGYKFLHNCARNGTF